MPLFVIGLSYRSAPVDVRERLAIPPARLRCYGCRLKLTGNLSEVVLLSTCNRVEIYGVSEWPKAQAHRLLGALTSAPVDFTPYLYIKEGTAAAEHLFSVAAGLDSMVIGETEITGQVKQAYQAAQEAGLTGRITNRLFQTALQAAKQLRTQTAIGRGATSVGSVAVELAERIFDQNLSEKTVLIVGAGKMGEACVRHLAKKGATSVLVANRSLERAEALAAQFGGQAVGMDRCLEAMTKADIVVSSTGSQQVVLSRAQVMEVMRLRRNRPLFLVDIAVPRDIDPGVHCLDNVYLYNVDHLEQIVQENVRLREQEIERCQELVAENAERLMRRLTQKSASCTPSNVINPGWSATAATYPM